MPDPRLVCEVRSGGGIFSTWLTVAVTYSYEDTNPIRRFALTCAEPSGKGALQLVPGDRVDVTLAGFKVIDNGYIYVRQAAYDANKHAVQISGLAKAGKIQQASADPGEYKGYSFSAVANKVAQKYGVKFRMVNPPSGADEPFRVVRPSYGETDWDLLSRLARMRGVLLTCAANGDLVGGVPDGGSGATLVEGKNILSCTAYLEEPWVETVIGAAQMPGSDGMFGRVAAEVASQTTISGGGQGLVQRIVAEGPLNPKENQIATNAYAADILRSVLRVTIVHQGWLKPGTNGLWELGDKVTVDSPMAFARYNPQELRVFTVTCAQNPEGQTTTTVQLVSENAFTRRFPDGQAASPFQQTAQAANIIMPS